MNIVLAADTGGSYVAAAYAVFFALLLIYVAIIAYRLANVQKTLSEILRQLDDGE